MIPELKEFKKKNHLQKRAAENAVFVADQIERLISESDGKTWVPILSLPQKPIAVICRAKDLEGTDYFYFCSEFTLSRGWVDFPSGEPEDNSLDWFNIKNVEALI